MVRLLAVCLFLCAAPALGAPVLAFHAPGDAGATHGLEAYRGAPVALLFWRADCAPCRRELAALPALARAHPALPILLVSLQPEGEAMPYFTGRAWPGNVHPVIADGDATQVLAAFGDAQQRLPFSVALAKDGERCGTHDGLLSRDTLSQWIAACTC